MSSQSKRAFITGVNGQDGAWLARRLLSEGMIVLGTVRNHQSSLSNLERLGIKDQVSLTVMDFEQEVSFDPVIDFAPDFVFNLGAYASLSQSERNEEKTLKVNWRNPRAMFEAVFANNTDARIFQASSALVFGAAKETPQNLRTPRNPDTFYGKAKNALDMDLLQWRSKGRFAVSGILYNHESMLRGEGFVSQKIVQGLKMRAEADLPPLKLGLFSDIRDWSAAEDFVDAMCLSLKADCPDEYIFASGEKHCVRDWLRIVSEFFDFTPVFEGDGLTERMVDGRTGQCLARVNQDYVRPDHGAPRVGAPSRAQKKLGWQRKYSFEAMVEKMCRHV